MNRKFFTLVLVIISFSGISCNLVLVAVKNVPTFFTAPEKVKNKIKNPIIADTRLSALWIGHSTVLLQMDDKVIITDPFLTETIGEFGRRIIEPGMDIKDIPACDLILISHSHFDHLSFTSLTMLEEKSSNTALVFPEDMENYLPDYNMKLHRMKNNNGFEYGFKGQSKIINGVKITSIIARHWGGRYGFDGYLWGDKAFTGYIIEYNGMTVYFAGDTGYEPESFKKIGKEYNIDLALIPIGPCADCNQCGTPNHVFPVDAVYLFKDVNPKWMVPIHYGTLQFARADPMQPLWALNEIIAKDSLAERIYPLKIGEQKIFIAKH